jgi:hypothetical protein
MIKSDKLYSVKTCTIHYKMCQILLFLCRLEYKVFHIEILHGGSIHHWLPLDFCFRIF